MMKLNFKTGLLFLCVLFFSMAAMAALPQYPDLSMDTEYSANGYFDVYVKSGGDWQPLAKLEFDKYFREKAVGLSSYVSANGTVDVRIVQKGGTAAHIDSILLDGKAPTSFLENHLPANLPKISVKDFDVIDGFGKIFECSFSGDADHAKLLLTARVEGEDASRVPFHFPLSNLYKKIDLESEFYTYRLTPEPASAPLEAAPLFKEFCRSGSGHPSSDVYGWVWNDDKNLYFNMDFTGDNTFDGLKDYARVFIKTDGKIKEFVMSMGDTRYGEPQFTYTDKVVYQHKVYPFTIPLSEISGEVSDNIELAFSGYGTFAAVQSYSIDYEVLLDTGDGGGEVFVAQAAGTDTISGVDYRVGARVEYQFMCDGPLGDGGCEGDWICTVSAVDNFIREWDGTNFVDNTPDGEINYPITGRFGRDNTMAVEFYAPIADIDNYDDSFTGVFHASILAANDFTSPFQYRQSSAAIPTMTEWGMILLSLALMIGAIRALKNNRYRNVAVCVMIICFVAGIAWAATIIINGDTGDWSGIQSVVADGPNDSSLFEIDPIVAANEDIRWGYVTSDNDNLYFRIDYTGSTEYPFGGNHGGGGF